MTLLDQLRLSRPWRPWTLDIQKGLGLCRTHAIQGGILVGILDSAASAKPAAASGYRNIEMT